MASARAATGQRSIPTLSGLAAARAYLRLRSDPLGALQAAKERHGEAVAFDFVFRTFVLLSGPDLIEHVLVKNAKNFSKNTWGYDQMRLVLGNGLLTSQGDFWMRQRRIAQPAFHRKKIAGFVGSMGAAAERLAEGWSVAVKGGRELDITAEMMAVTLEVVGKTLLSVDVGDTARSVGDSVTAGLTFVAHRMRTRVPVPLWWPIPRHVRFRRGMAELDRIVYGIIGERRRTGEDAGDLLSMFMLTRDEETGESMNDEQLRDEVMTMYLAGHETTAMNLSWTFYALAQNPDVEEALRDELERVLGGRTPTFEDLSELELLSRVVKESLRLYPPAPVVARMTEGDDVVGDFALAKGSYILVSPFVTQRDPELWPDPERFDPGRFEPELERERPKFAYFPFSGGQRKCIGDQFALVEAQVILATLLQRFRLSLRPGYVAEPEPTITLRPRGGLPMTVRAV